MLEHDDKIYIASSEGMIGSALVRYFKENYYRNIIALASSELDLSAQAQVRDFFKRYKPKYVILPSVKIGGIKANSQYPADFIYDNLISEINIIRNAWECDVQKLLFLGSSCIYPKFSPQPIKETYLLDGKMEKTSEAYATAKLAGIRMCQAFSYQYGVNYISGIPADIYGPEDDFNPETGHVLPSLITRIHQAKQNGNAAVTLWGTGTPRREALYIDDLADACIFLLNKYDNSEIINIGTGKDISISEMAKIIKTIVGYKGTIQFDKSKPDGTPRKLLDTEQINKMGWNPKFNLNEGIEKTYKWYLESINK